MGVENGFNVEFVIHFTDIFVRFLEGKVDIWWGTACHWLSEGFVDNVLDFLSNHPYSTKFGIPTSLFIFAQIKISSTLDSNQTFQANNYPSHIITVLLILTHHCEISNL